jgi:hypothetical protein
MSAGHPAGLKKAQGRGVGLQNRAYSGVAPQGQAITNNFMPSPSLPALPQGGHFFRQQLAAGPSVQAAASPPPPALMPFLGSHSHRMRPLHGPGSAVGKAPPQDSVSSVMRHPGRHTSPQQCAPSENSPGRVILVRLGLTYAVPSQKKGFYMFPFVNSSWAVFIFSISRYTNGFANKSQ